MGIIGRVEHCGAVRAGERKEKVVRKLLLPFLTAMFLAAGGALCMAEPLDFSDMDLRFVDAWGNTGYYVDMNSVQIQDEKKATARVEIVKADANCLYLYTVAFDRGKRTYQILDSVIAQYDTKEQTGGSVRPTSPQSYGAGSAWETVVEYIYSPQL